MDANNFIRNFANAIEVDAAILSGATVFKDLDNWDSLCVLSVIAMVDEVYHVTLGGDDLESSNTISDLMGVLSKRK